jgi:hypothetical protein
VPRLSAVGISGLQAGEDVNMQVAILHGNTGINLVSADSVGVVAALGETAMDGTGAKIGDIWTGAEFVPPAAPVREWGTALDFMKAFTLAEEASIRAAAKNDLTLEVFLARLSAAPYVRSDDQLTIQGMEYLVMQGLITEARKDEILGA